MSIRYLEKPQRPTTVLNDETGTFVMTDRISSVHRGKDEGVLTTVSLRGGGHMMCSLSPKEIRWRMYNG